MGVQQKIMLHLNMKEITMMKYMVRLSIILRKTHTSIKMKMPMTMTLTMTMKMKKAVTGQRCITIIRNMA
jgi:hypothetical protein